MHVFHTLCVIRMKRVQTHTLTIYTEAKINRKMDPQLALESASQETWHCVAQLFQNAAQRSAKLPGRPILRPVGGHFPIYLGLGVYGHSPCLHSLHEKGTTEKGSHKQHACCFGRSERTQCRNKTQACAATTATC